MEIRAGISHVQQNFQTGQRNLGLPSNVAMEESGFFCCATAVKTIILAYAVGAHGYPHGILSETNPILT